MEHASEGVMESFNLVHVFPPERAYMNLLGYRDVMDFVKWGLIGLGHEVTETFNDVRPNCRNIIFGGQLWPIQLLQRVPPGGIIYNLEKVLFLHERDHQLAERLHMLDHMHIWDYSQTNVAAWNALAARHGSAGTAKFVPIGFAPEVNRLVKPAEQDIDVLIYGTPSETRLKAFADICRQHLKSMFIYGLYGEERDRLIERSKIVLNVGHGEPVFEIARVSFLLANKKAVVADAAPGMTVDADLVDAVLFTEPDAIANACLMLALADDARAALEQRGFDAFSQRDAAAILKYALEVSQPIA